MENKAEWKESLWELSQLVPGESELNLTEGETGWGIYLKGTLSKLCYVGMSGSKSNRLVIKEKLAIESGIDYSPEEVGVGHGSDFSDDHGEVTKIIDLSSGKGREYVRSLLLKLERGRKLERLVPR